MAEPNPSKKERREAAREARLEAERKAAASDARKRRLTMLGGVLALAAVLVVAAILISSSGGEETIADNADAGVLGVSETNAMFNGVPQDGTVLGNKNAPVTLYQAEDPQCPACKAYSEQVLPKVIQDQVRTGRAKVDLRFFPFIGPDSTRGAQFVLAAQRQDLGFNTLELIYRNQGTENDGYMTDAYLRKVGGAVQGLDVNRALSEMNSPEIQQELADQKRFGTINGATGTPTLWTQRGSGDLDQLDSFDEGTVTQAITAATTGS